MKNLSFSQGDILVVQIDPHQFSTQYLSMLQGRLHRTFDLLGITILLVPKDIELNSIHIHKGNTGKHEYKLEDGSVTALPNKEGVGTDGRQYRMIRAHIEEVIELIKPSLPPSKRRKSKS